MAFMTTPLLTKANTILSQLGGAGRLGVMIGAHTFLGTPEGALSFRFKARAKDGINYVRVTLQSDDTYRLEMLQLRGVNSYSRADVEGLHAEDLVRVISERTGLALTMPRVIGL